MSHKTKKYLRLAVMFASFALSAINEGVGLLSESTPLPHWVSIVTLGLGLFVRKAPDFLDEAK